MPETNCILDEFVVQHLEHLECVLQPVSHGGFR